jgi:hypothetical protein
MFGCPAVLETDSVLLKIHSIWFNPGQEYRNCKANQSGDSSVAELAQLQSNGRLQRRAHPVVFAIVAALVSEFGDSWLPACTGDKKLCFSPLVGSGTKGKFPLVVELRDLNKSVL